MKNLLIKVLRNELNKLEDKGWYHPESLTKHDYKRYDRMNAMWHKLLNI